MGRKRLHSNEDVLRAIERLIARKGMPPTVEELRKELDVGSKRTVLRYLRELEERGDIDRWSGARGIRLRRVSGGSRQTVPVPLVGEAPAGPQVLAQENREGHIRLPREIAGPEHGTFFLLRVRGDSMNRADVDGKNIESGDLVLVRQQPDAETGDIVVALIDGEATIKRLVKGTDYFLLRPESVTSEYDPIIVEDDITIQGIVQGVIKDGAELLD